MSFLLSELIPKCISLASRQEASRGIYQVILPGFPATLTGIRKVTDNEFRMDTAMAAHRVRKIGKTAVPSGRPQKRPSPEVKPECLPTNLGEIKSAFETLQEQAAQRFEQLFQGLPLSCYCYDTDGRIMEWNRISETLLRRPAAQALFLPVWEVVGRHQDAEILRAFVRSVIAGEAYEGVEWEDTAPDGTPRYLLCNAFPMRDRTGAITGGITVSVDITERAQSEQALWENEERWQLALRGNHDGIWDWNARAGRLFLSARGRQIFGEEESENVLRSGGCIGKEIHNGKEPAGFCDAWFQRVHPDDRESAVRAFEAHLSREKAFYGSEHRVRCQDDAYRWVLDRGQALWDRSGLLVRMAGSVTDITERKRWEQNVQEANAKLEEANRKLEALATQDGLTELKNHRAFQERLMMEMERARRYGFPLSLALLDVDHFKQYNDTFGHPAGDLVLRTVAERLTVSVREADLVARYGGEEFVLILPHAQAAEALVVAERCRRAIETADWPARPVTASVGVATLIPAITTQAELIVAADQALYAAKRSGRNRVIVAAP